MSSAVDGNLSSAVDGALAWHEITSFVGTTTWGGGGTTVRKHSFLVRKQIKLCRLAYCGETFTARDLGRIRRWEDGLYDVTK